MGCIREQGRDGADYDFLAQNNFDYMIQRPKDGTIIVGGGRWKVSVENLIGNTDDSVKIPDLTEYLREVMKKTMTGWGEEALNEGLLVDWTGIMGYTPEAVPYVGAVHGKPGAFISAGHSGHGEWYSSLIFELCCRTVG